MNKDQIKRLQAKKHVKIYLLSKTGLTNKEVSQEAGTNAGHVYNVLKDYSAHPEKGEAAEKLISEPVS